MCNAKTYKTLLNDIHTSWTQISKMLDKGKCLQNSERDYASICMLVNENSALSSGPKLKFGACGEGIQCMVRVVLG